MSKILKQKFLQTTITMYHTIYERNLTFLLNVDGSTNKRKRSLTKT